MSGVERIYDIITNDDLRQLSELSLKEHEEFFKRNRRLKGAYFNSLIGVCLCQGAASHYINPNIGIKDFDIWFFYVENKSIDFPYRAIRTIKKGYKNKPIDFLRRAIPKGIYDLFPDDPEKIIMKYLLEKNTTTKKFLIKKAIIGLFPKKIYGKVLNKGEL
jgi:hypothetical protein